MAKWQMAKAKRQRGEGKAGLPVSGNTYPEVSP